MKWIGLLFFILTFSRLLSAQQIDSFIIDSKILNKPVHYLLYTPKMMKPHNKKVIYLLHGAGGNHQQWLQEGRIHSLLDTNTAFKNCVVVMPDAGMTYYLNDEDGHQLYEDFFIQEFIPQIERKFNCGAAKENRIISGLSMGGFGALLYSFHHPDLFAACFAFSAGIRTNDEIIRLKKEEYAKRYGSKYADFPEKRINQHWNKNSLIYLADTMKISDLSKTKIFIDIGDDDFLYKGNISLYLKLKERKIPFEFSIRNGEHNWVYWQESFKLALPKMIQILY
ncbi:MAG: alpha/beta hydrolase [Bacteroidia bacterium]